MSFNKKFFTTGGIVASSDDAVCNTESKYAFGANNSFTSNIVTYELDGDGGTTNNVPDTTTNNNGTATSVTYSSTVSKFGSAAAFDGYNSEISANNVSALNNLTEISVSFWFRWDDSASVTDFGHMINIGTGALDNGEYFGIAIGDNGTTFDRVLYGYFPEGSSSTGQTVTANVWHHVVVTYSGTTIKYYYDGSLIDTQTKTALSLPSSGNHIRIGSYRFNGLHHFKGYLDQIRIFNREINAHEVNTLYGETTSTASNTNPFNEGQGVALYSFDYDGSDSGDLYTGTDSGSITYGISGAIGGYGARFDGAFSYIDATGLYQKNVGTTSLWFKKDGNPSDAEILFASGYASSEKGVIAQIMNSANNGKLRLIVQDTGGAPNAVDLRTSGNYNDNNWHHVVFTWDLTQTGSNIASRIYVDNTLVASDTIFGHNSGSGTVGWTSGNSTYDVHIGVYKTLSTTNAFGGDLDQMRFFDGVLTSDQVETLYEERVCVHTGTANTADFPSGVTAAAHYPLDNSSEDNKGTNDGTDTNIQYRFGRYGQAAGFETTTSKIDIGNQTFFNSNYTMSMWFFPTDTTGTTVQILAIKRVNDDAIAPITLYLREPNDTANPQKIQWGVGGGGSYYNYVYSGEEFMLNTWNFLAVRIDGTSQSLFLNGVKSTGTFVGTRQTNSATIKIGNHYATNGDYPYEGKLDQIRIYSSALSDDEIDELYNEKPVTDTSNFKPVLYKGNNTIGHYISNVGINLDVDDGGDGGLVWLKNRTTANSHCLFDTIRGANFRLLSNSNQANTNVTTNITSFDANGFFLGNAGGVNANSNNYVAWVWKGGGDAVTLTNAGNVNSDVSVNNAAGFSIVKASYGSHGSGTGYTKTVKHGLTTDPEIIITKSLGTSNWVTMADTLIGEGKHLLLNDDASIGTDPGFVINTDGTFQTAYSTGAHDIIAYCWHSVAGYSKIGIYEGDGNTNRQVTDVGFQPNFLLIKNSENSVTDWLMYDSKRGTTPLAPNQSFAESTYGTSYEIEFISTGFKIVDSNNATNQASNDFIYMAFK